LYSIKNRNKKGGNSGANDNTENSKSNYLNSFYSLETKDDQNTNTNFSCSRYKLGSTSISKIDYKTKNKLRNENLDEIPEVKEETYFAKAKKKVFSGAKFISDRCEIL